MLRLQNVFKCYHVSIISVHLLLCNGICHLAFLQVFFLYTLNIFLPIFLGLCLFIPSLWVHLIGLSCMFSQPRKHMLRSAASQAGTKDSHSTLCVREHWCDSQEPRFLAMKRRIYSPPAFSATKALEGFQELIFLAKGWILLMHSLSKGGIPIFQCNVDAIKREFTWIRMSVGMKQDCPLLRLIVAPNIPKTKIMSFLLFTFFMASLFVEHCQQ